MRDLRAAIAKGNELAKMAVGQFTYVLRKFLGSYMTVLGGLDLLVFAGGIGEHDVATRREVCEGLEDVGIVLDPARNERLQPDDDGRAVISADGSTVKVMVIPPLEDLMIANHVYSLLNT